MDLFSHLRREPPIYDLFSNLIKNYKFALSLKLGWGQNCSIDIHIIIHLLGGIKKGLIIFGTKLGISDHSGVASRKGHKS